jgi:hypothetical protein
MAIVGTGPIITTYGSDLAHIGRKPEWQVYDVEGQAWDQSDEANESAVLRSLPIGTVIMDVHASVTRAAAATGEDRIDLVLALAGGDQVFWASSADTGGVVDRMDHGHIVSSALAFTVFGASRFPVAEKVNLEVKRTITADTGTGITGTAKYRVGILLCRPEYDR